MREHERLEKITSLIRRLEYDLHASSLTTEDKHYVIMRLLEYALENCYLEEEV